MDFDEEGDKDEGDDEDDVDDGGERSSDSK